MESVDEFVERYNRENRAKHEASLKHMFNLTDEQAQAMYKRMLMDVIEAAIVAGDVEPEE